MVIVILLEMDEMNWNCFLIFFFCSMGIPLVVVIGRKAADAENALFELHFTDNDTSVDLSFPDLIQEIFKIAQSSRK